METIPPERANEMMSSGAAVVVDIRDPQKYADGHIRRAMNAEYHPKTFARDTERIDRNAAVILYCDTGLKTKKAAGAELERRGFSRGVRYRGRHGGMEEGRFSGHRPLITAAARRLGHIRERHRETKM
ncbi:MAG: rhodanese-like domain-containing protein [Spirochaetota bacterium]